MKGWKKKSLLIAFSMMLTILLIGCQKQKEAEKETIPPPTETEVKSESVPGEEEEITSLYDVEEEESEGNGKYFVAILDTDVEKRTITFDKERILFVGQDDDKIKELGEEPEESASGYYIYNEEEKSQTLPLAKDVNINVIDFESDAPATSFNQVDAETFLKNYKEGMHPYCYITVKDQKITDIYEQFLP